MHTVLLKRFRNVEDMEAFMESLKNYRRSPSADVRDARRFCSSPAASVARLVCLARARSDVHVFFRSLWMSTRPR